MLIATFAKRCTIKGMNFEIATGLAWFSSMTHLATLSVLRLYFRERPRLRLVRLVGMVTVLVLLITTVLLLANFDIDGSTPVQCAFTAPAIVRFISGINQSSAFLFSIFNPFSFVWFILCWLIAYGNRIISLYYADSKVTLFGLLLRKL